MEFNPPNDDFSPGNLSLVRDSVRISLFEEIVCDDKDMGGFLEGENTTRAEKLFIGSIDIPFSTIFMEGTINGTFMLDCPDLRCGYVCDTFNDTIKTEEATKDVSLSEIREKTGESSTSCSMRLLLTINPLLQFVDDAEDDDIDNQDNRLPREFLPFLSNWKQTMSSTNNASSRRHYDVFGTCTNGEKVLMTRFIQPQTPPDCCKTFKSCLHFVRLIPFIEDWQLFTKSSSRVFVGEMDMWCTTQEFLNLTAGDWEEHACLLCNYLLWIANDSKNSTRNEDKNGIKQVYLAVGKAVPQGECVFIVVLAGSSLSSEVRKEEVDEETRDRKLKNMRKKRNQKENNRVVESVLEFYDSTAEALANLSMYGNTSGRVPRRRLGDSHVYLIDAVSGNCFTVGDPSCPFKDISSLISADNIYGNVQDTLDIESIEFDVLNSRNWMPMFSDENQTNKLSFPRPESGLGSIQVASPEYIEPDIVNAIEIQNSISNMLKTSFRRWRTGNKITTYHKETTSALYDMLALLENKKMGQNNLDMKEELDKKLAIVSKTRIVLGFPLNLPFTDLDVIDDTVRSTCMYDNSHPDVQFAIAVRVFAFPCHVLSIWLFLAQITPK